MISSSPLGHAKCTFPLSWPLPACVSSIPREAIRATIATPVHTPKSCSRGATPAPSIQEASAAPVMPPTLNMP